MSIHQDTFSISENNVYCYKPLVCSTIFGYCIVWATDDGLYAKTIDPLGQGDQKSVQYTIALGHWDPIFLKSISGCIVLGATGFGSNSESSSTFRLFILGDNAELIDHFDWSHDPILAMWEGFGFTYNDRTEVLTVYEFDPEPALPVGFSAAEPKTPAAFSLQTALSEAIPTFTVTKVYSTPVIMPLANSESFLAAWLDKWDQIHFTNGKDTVIINSPMDYLVGAANGTNVVLVGYSNIEDTLTILDIDKTLDYNTKTIIEPEYHNASFYAASLHNGFMLLADNAETAMYQRFTKTNCYLYPMTPINSKHRTWNPVLAQNDHTCLMVFIEDHGDNSIICGQYIRVGEIPELD